MGRSAYSLRVLNKRSPWTHKKRSFPSERGLRSVKGTYSVSEAGKDETVLCEFVVDCCDPDLERSQEIRSSKQAVERSMVFNL